MKLLLKGLAGLLVVLVLLVGGLLLFLPGIHSSSLPMILNVMSGNTANTPPDILLQRLQAREGYQVVIFARGLSNPRMLASAGDGQLLVSSPRNGEILLIRDSDGDGAADEQTVLLNGLKRPQGIVLHDGWLYVAESSQLGRIGFDAAAGKTSGSYELLVTDLTDNGNHWSKTLRFDKQGWMYVSMGSTCNVCEEVDRRRATIMRYRADGSAGEIYASGLRNSVGLDFAPWDGMLYATDNGRDLLGDDYPPCELNQIQQGGFYGWPYLNGNNELDPDFGAGHEALQASAVPPVFSFPAHNAPLGIHFVRGNSDADLQRAALVALHGSWNRSQPDGYKVVSLHWNDQGEISSEDFLWGFERDGDIVGRPVDISGDGQGGFFVSDDYAGVIYRLSRGKSFASATAQTVVVAVDSQYSTDPAQVAAGAELYQSLPCADCHAESALTPVPLDRIVERYNLDTLADYFVTPTPPMPLFDLDQVQREQLAHFLLDRAAMREQSPAEM
jgi:glucose/arabinose dehydrogenase